MTDQEKIEQEKREKAIKELESDICKGCKYAKGKDLCCICEVKDYAKTLADLHYRKEEEVQKECDKNAYNAWKGMFGVKEKAIREEVRKETAREILQTLFNNLKYPQHFQVYIETLAQKFGVEVKE